MPKVRLVDSNIFVYMYTSCTFDDRPFSAIVYRTPMSTNNRALELQSSHHHSQSSASGNTRSRRAASTTQLAGRPDGRGTLCPATIRWRVDSVSIVPRPDSTQSVSTALPSSTVRSVTLMPACMHPNVQSNGSVTVYSLAQYSYLQAEDTASTKRQCFLCSSKWNSHNMCSKCFPLALKHALRQTGHWLIA